MPKVTLDGNMYLFTQAEGAYNDVLVISAHGGIERNAQLEDVGSRSILQFYSQHGSVTSDYGINFASGGKKSQRADALPPGAQAYNYTLTKYQGRHAGSAGKPAETYESIEDAQNYTEELLAMMMSDEGKKIAANTGLQPVRFDVLTIRNRGDEVTLKHALKHVYKKNVYREIHCYFCRSFY